MIFCRISQVARLLIALNTHFILCAVECELCILSFYQYFFLFFFFFRTSLTGSQSPDQELSLCRLQWRHKALTTGPPWKSLLGLSYTRATSLMEEAFGRMGPRPGVRCLRPEFLSSSFCPLSICSSASFFLLHLVPLPLSFFQSCGPIALMALVSLLFTIVSFLCEVNQFFIFREILEERRVNVF